MKNALVVLLAVVLTVGISLPAQAEGAKNLSPVRLTVKVDGLACPFCAYGLEKKLKRIEGVENLKISIDTGKVAIDVKGDTRLMSAPDAAGKTPPGLVARIRQAVKEAGFSPKGVEVTIAGKVTNKAGSWMLRASETGDVLPLKENGQKAALEAAAAKDRVVLTGVLEGEGPTLALAVEQIGEGASASTGR